MPAWLYTFGLTQCLASSSQDLVVDMSNFYAQYKHIQPYLQTTKPKP